MLPTVLIVDDVAGNLVALEAMLRRSDIEIVTAASGPAALEILLERGIALALLDVQMPDMDGFMLAKLMRGVERTKHVPIIFLTAATRDLSRVFEGYEAGAVDFLYKPVEPEILRSKVEVFVTLERRREALRQEERMREMFVGILGHDLRNPLHSILMSTQLAIRCSEDERVRELLQRTLASSRRMVRMIDQLLDVTRLRLGSGIDLSRSVTDLRRLADQALAEFEQLRERFSVEAIGDVSGSWDADRVLQVLSNLVGNAAQHSPSGSPIRIQIDGGAEDTVCLSVHNTGATIPKDLRGVLFDPFRGSGDSGHGKKDRLGLGLYITRQIVLAHGGAIAFESGEESGTRFVVTLPRRPAEPVEGPPAQR